MTIKRRLGYTLLGLVAVLILALCTIDRTIYSDYFVQHALRAVNSSGSVRVTVERSDIFLLGLKSSGVRVTFPRAFSSFRLESLSSSLPISSLLGLSPKFLLTGEAYGGHINGSFESSSPGRANLSLENLNLNQHDQILGFGITDGTLSSNFSLDQVHSPPLPTGSGSIHLAGVKKPRETKIRGSLIGLPGDLIIPAVSDLNLEIHWALNNKALSVDQIELSSSIARFTGKFLGDVDTSGRIQPRELTGDLSVSAEASQTVIPWVSLLCGGKEIAPDTKVKINMTFSSPFPRTRCT